MRKSKKNELNSGEFGKLFRCLQSLLYIFIYSVFANRQESGSKAEKKIEESGRVKASETEIEIH